MKKNHNNKTLINLKDFMEFKKMINSIILFILFISFGYSNIINVSNDGSQAYEIIQDAINDAQIGDTILVHQGVYFENLDINKTITLASYALYDNLDSWYQYESITGKYEVTNINISNTIIDASNPMDDNFKSGIMVRSPENNCISPIIMGFTIRGGMGTKVTEAVQTSEGQQQVNKMIGGGIFSYLTNATIHHNKFIDNGDFSVENGGAVYSQTSTEDWGFDNRSEGLPRCEINQINLHNNFYRGNDAFFGNTFSNRTFSGEINLSNSLFDIYNCPQQSVAGVWVDIESNAEVNYLGSEGDLCSISNDIWISPEGNNWTGEGTQNNPIQTIKHALEIISPSETNPVTIHLAAGTYSPSNSGELFSLNLISNINIEGAGPTMTKLDAEDTDNVLYLLNCNNIRISDLTIKNGRADFGAGLDIIYSDIKINNVNFDNNYAEAGNGGAIHIWESNPTMHNIKLRWNHADGIGGGMVMWNSDPIIDKALIIGNWCTWGVGGGIYCHNSNPIINRMTLASNYAVWTGGMLLIEDSDPIITNSILRWNENENITATTLGTDTPSIYNSNFVSAFLYYSGNSNTSELPLFVSDGSPSWDYSLKVNSPCIDSGIDFLEINEYNVVNLDQSDFLGSAPDMGAIEYIPYGDIDFNNYVDVQDIVMIVNYIFGNIALNDQQKIVANLNDDNLINIFDILLIIHLIDTDFFSN